MTAPAPRPRPVLRYHGSKWRIAPRILKYFPPHRIYVEAFGGGASLLLRKQPSKIEIYNDLDGEVVNLFRVLRDPQMRDALVLALELTPYARAEYVASFEHSDDPVESARRLVTRAYMGFGSNAGLRKSQCGFRGSDWSSRQANNHLWTTLPLALKVAADRFKGVVIENRPALELLPAQDSAQTLFYLDPPYLLSTRAVSRTRWDKQYRFEMEDHEHVELAKAARALKGYVIVSGYPSLLYNDLYHDWTRINLKAQTIGKALDVHRIEVLWLSPRTAAALEGAA